MSILTNTNNHLLHKGKICFTLSTIMLEVNQLRAKVIVNYTLTHTDTAWLISILYLYLAMQRLIFKIIYRDENQHLSLLKNST